MRKAPRQSATRPWRHWWPISIAPGLPANHDIDLTARPLDDTYEPATATRTQAAIALRQRFRAEP